MDTERRQRIIVVALFLVLGLPFISATYQDMLGMFGVRITAQGSGTILRVTADRQNTTTTFANVTNLTLTVNASTAYTFHCQLHYTTAVGTTGLQLSINGPASPTAMRYSVHIATTATAVHNSSQLAYDTVVNPATSLGTTALPAEIFGTLENGLNAGTLAIRFRSEINASAVNILRGSFCVVQ